MIRAPLALVAPLLVLLTVAVAGAQAPATAPLRAPSPGDEVAPPLLSERAPAEAAEARAAELRARTFEALVDVFAAHYWDPGYRDWNAWADGYRASALAADSRIAFDSVLRRMVADLHDDHSRWVGRVEAGGAVLPPDARPQLGFRATQLRGAGLVVERVFAGSPAAAAGLERGDVITAVDGTELAPLRREAAMARVDAAARRGRAALALQRGRQRLLLHIAAEPFDAAAAADRPSGRLLSGRIAYLHVPSFQGPEVAREAHHLIEGFAAAGADGLVLDLRGNPGGRLTEMGLLLGAFIEGPFAEAVSRERVVWRGSYERAGERGVARLERLAGNEIGRQPLDGAARWTGDLVVLVDERSSSAGELAAAILQDLGRARVVGVPTAGNVEAVRGFGLPDGSLVMVAVADLRGVHGTRYSGGIDPDVIAREDLHSLARGFDAPVAEGVRLLEGNPFVEGRFF